MDVRKYKLLSIAILVSIVWIIFGSIRLAANHTPDAGLEILNYVGAGLILCAVALLVDLFLAFRRSVTHAQQPAVQRRSTFWQIIGVLVVLAVIYFVYVLAAS